MSDGFAIGIDLGTSTSEICAYRPGRDPHVFEDLGTRSPIVPSLVAIDPTGGFLVGEAARPYWAIEDRCVREVKRLMGTEEKVILAGQSYRPEEISAHILSYLKKTAGEALGEDVVDAVITVPAKFDDPQRKATIAAAKIAGLNVLRLINEPTAAALAYGISEIDSEGQLVVFDFGGGTLDITILEMMEGVLDVKATYGDDKLGGKDLDEALIRLVVGRFVNENPGAKLPPANTVERILKDPVEHAKKDLSSGESAGVVVASFAAGPDGAPVDLSVVINRAEFEEAIRPLLDQARACIASALKAKDTRPSSIDKVLLVGGSTYVPAVRRLVAETFPVAPEPSLNPDLAVATGAALRAAMALHILDEAAPVIADVCSHGFGVDVVSILGSQPALIYDQLIAPQTTIPYATKREYSLISPDQRGVKVSLYQSFDGSARFPHEAREIAQARIDDIPPALYGDPHPIEIEFSYSLDGTIEVLARIPGIGKCCEIAVKTGDDVMSEEDLVAAAERVRDAWKQNPAAERYQALIARAEGAMEQSPSADHHQVSGAIADLKSALASRDDDAIKAAGDALTDILFDLQQDAG